jgi:hypothetical protein
MRATFSLALVVVLASQAAGAIAFPGGYTQNFDSLANTGTDVPWVDNTTLPGWYSTRTDYRTGAGTKTGKDCGRSAHCSIYRVNDRACCLATH